MIGRQGLYVDRPTTERLLAEFGHPVRGTDLDSVFEDGFCEGLLRLLGAKVTDSFDASNFESATFVHDMNQPIGEEFKGRYSVVLDGGTLEHVFNFPTAIRNCMEMVRPGGHFLGITPANNWFGHGFYQFSPELYFRVLSPENGFRVEHMIAFEEVERPIWHRVSDPSEVGDRVTLQNDQPVYLLIIARRIDVRPIFQSTPQQSDYIPRWSGEETAEPVEVPAAPPLARPLPIRLAKMVVPSPVRRSLRTMLERPPRRKLGFDPRFFRRMPP